MAILTYGDSFAELNALFNAVFSGYWNTIAQNAGSPATNLYVSLHNGDPGPTGSQNTNETGYSNYARVAVARSSAGWTVTQGSGTTFSNVTNAAAINFPACGASGDILTHWGIGLAASGAGTLLAYGSLGPQTGPAIPFTCTSASPGVLTAYGYTPVVNDRVSVWQLPGTEGLPTGLTEGTIYYVGTAPGGNTLTLSTTPGNANPVNTSSTGSGVLYKCGPLVVSTLVAPSFAAGTFNIQKA